MPYHLTQEQETQLLKKLSKGDHEAYEHLFYAFYADLCRYGLKFVREPSISEEIVQEVFVYLWEKRSSMTITTSCKAYLYTAVRNKSINYLKLQLPKDQAKDDISKHEIAGLTDVDDDLRYNELEGKVAAAIDLLPKKCKIIFDLSRNAGLSYKEIAAELDISIKTVENQMVIALRKLRASLDPYLNPDENR
ncbi:MAG: RNA polymerase sigma-70 factor [Cyclobacteriaceae bacterium]